VERDAKFVLLIPIFLAYLVPLDVVVTGNITAKICDVWSEFNIFCTLVTMGMAAILNLFNPPERCLRWTNFAAVAMETKKGGFKTFLDSIHQAS
jgi:hypothetical protein